MSNVISVDTTRVTAAASPTFVSEEMPGLQVRNFRLAPAGGPSGLLGHFEVALADGEIVLLQSLWRSSYGNGYNVTDSYRRLLEATKSRPARWVGSTRMGDKARRVVKALALAAFAAMSKAAPAAEAEIEIDEEEASI